MDSKHGLKHPNPCTWSLSSVKVTKVYTCKQAGCEKQTQVTKTYGYRRSISVKSEIDLQTNSLSQSLPSTVCEHEDFDPFETAFSKMSDQPILDDLNIGRDVEIKSSDELVGADVMQVDHKMFNLDSDFSDKAYLNKQDLKNNLKDCSNFTDRKPLTKKDPDTTNLQLKDFAGNLPPKKPLTFKSRRVRKKKTFFDENENYPVPKFAHKYKRKPSLDEEVLCELCGKHCSSKRRLTYHKDMSHREKRFTCNMCGLKFLRKAALLGHLNRVKRKNLKCEQCDLLFCTQRSLGLHTMCHVEKPGPDTEVYQCEHCDMYFGTWLGCFMHARRHVADEPCHCQVCGQSFSKVYDLNEHFKSHSEQEQRQQTEWEDRKENLPVPQSEDTNHAANSTCEFCGEMLTSRAFQMAHRIMHTTVKPYVCNLCGKQFPHTHGFCSHMLSHTKERLFKCSVCGKTYIYKEQLKKHMLSHQSYVEKPYKCDICKQRFLMSSRLIYHLKIHTGERPHMCDQCGKKFRLKTGLKRHMMIHGGEKPFTCSYCEKPFYTSGQMKIHLRIHTGEKPFACPYCDKRCAMRANLRKHIAVHFRDTGIDYAKEIGSAAAVSIEYSRSESDDQINKVTGIEAECCMQLL